jgi:hypothetical protein
MSGPFLSVSICVHRQFNFFSSPVQDQLPFHHSIAYCEAQERIR